MFQIKSKKFAERYRAALVSVACDIPVSRTVGGFLGHAARRGCNNCKREFVGVFQVSSFHDFMPGESRTDFEHREQVRLIGKAGKDITR